MKLVRKLALGLSVVLLVALAVVGVARRSQLAGDRDHQLTGAAELGSERVAALVGTLSVAATAGSDPAATVASVADLAPGLGVCAVTDDATEAACAGDGTLPSESQIAARADRRRAGLLDQRPSADVRDDQLVLAVDGANVSLIAQVGSATLFAGLSDSVTVWLTESLPADTPLGSFLVADGQRQYAVPVAELPGTYLVTAGDDAVHTPRGELALYLLVGLFAVALGAAAGIASVVDVRSLRDRASIDQLTRLPNRSEFERRTNELITQSERTGRGFAILLFDLNGFKAVNDTYGHNAGDELLQVIGERLARNTRSGDTVARWGGDEFVVVMPGVVDDEMGLRRGREIAASISGRTRIDSARESVRVGASVGVAFWPRHGERLTELVEAADAAMYTAKRQGLGVVVAGRPFGSPAPAVATDAAPDVAPTELV